MLLRAPILNPQPDGTVQWIRDGALACDDRGQITFAGAWDDYATRSPAAVPTEHVTGGVVLPPFLDNHIHIPQHPIRGRFMEGVEPNPPGGRLLAGLNRNVFPAEQRCEHPDVIEQVVRDFLADTLAKGVIGGAAYMTVHAPAAAAALRMLPPLWHVGLVLMNQNCPAYLRSDEANLDRDVAALAGAFGARFILTDRFAVAVDSPLRRRAVELSRERGLRMQTHLNEQLGEKRFVEDVLYPDATSYTDVYARDGLLERRPILAHCIHMGRGEFAQLAGFPGAAIAHCPTSNTLLGSGIMPLDLVEEIARTAGVEWAICTDVGASPTTSLLNEMAQFLKVHRRRCAHATPQAALYRTTLAAAQMLGVADALGHFAPGRPMSFIEVSCDPARLAGESADDVILGALLETSATELDAFAQLPACRAALDALAAGGLDIGPDLDCLSTDIARTVRRLDHKVARVVLAGKPAWTRG